MAIGKVVRTESNIRPVLARVALSMRNSNIAVSRAKDRVFLSRADKACDLVVGERQLVGLRRSQQAQMLEWRLGAVSVRRPRQPIREGTQGTQVGAACFVRGTGVKECARVWGECGASVGRWRAANYLLVRAPQPGVRHKIRELDRVQLPGVV
jgi:hypothetical protein